MVKMQYVKNVKKNKTVDKNVLELGHFTFTDYEEPTAILAGEKPVNSLVSVKSSYHQYHINNFVPLLIFHELTFACCQLVRE